MSPASAASSRILVVDDTPANIQTLAAILKANGYQISIATNRKTGAESAGPRPARPHPARRDDAGDGRLRNLPPAQGRRAWRAIPIIFLTAKTETADIVKGFELGAVDYVAKHRSTPTNCSRASHAPDLRRSAPRAKSASCTTGGPPDTSPKKAAT